jgi:hypothetical protein
MTDRLGNFTDVGPIPHQTLQVIPVALEGFRITLEGRVIYLSSDNRLRHDLKTPRLQSSDHIPLPETMGVPIVQVMKLTEFSKAFT